MTLKRRPSTRGESAASAPPLRPALASGFALFLRPLPRPSGWPHPAGPDLGRFTPREWQILERLRQGCGDDTIASELGITSGTVKSHLVKIRARLGLRTRKDLLSWLRDGMPR